MIGDTCNMVGASLTHQQSLQQIIGIYYIIQDMILLMQFFYYSKIYQCVNLNRRRFSVQKKIILIIFRRSNE